MPLYSRSQRISSRTKRSGANTAPVNFNPAECPILATHFFGIEPPRPIGQIPKGPRAEVAERLNKDSAMTWDEIVRDLAEQDIDGDEAGVSTDA